MYLHVTPHPFPLEAPPSIHAWAAHRFAAFYAISNAVEHAAVAHSVRMAVGALVPLSYATAVARVRRSRHHQFYLLQSRDLLFHPRGGGVPKQASEIPEGGNEPVEGPREGIVHRHFTCCSPLVIST